MKLKAAIFAVCLALVVSVAWATTNVSTATWTTSVIPKNTNTFQVKHFFPFPLSRPGMINSDVLNSTGLNLALCTAMDCSGTGVEVPYQGGPVTSTVEYYFTYDPTNNFSNYTTQAQSAATGDTRIFVTTTTVANGDAVYYGFDSQQRIITPNLSTAGAGSWQLAWSYSSEAATESWNALSNVADGTDGYMNAGPNEVTWDLPLDWVSSTVNGQAAFWVRSSVTGTTSVITSPVGSQVFQEQGFFTAVATTTGQNFSKNTERTLHMYAGGGTDFVSFYPIIASRIETPEPVASLGTNDFIFEWRGYYGNDPITDIFNAGSAFTVDWICSGGACGPSVSMTASGTPCSLSATDSAWINKVITIRIRGNNVLNQCRLDVEGVEVDSDSLNGGIFTGNTWAWNFDNISWLEYASTTIASGTADLYYELNETVLASSTAWTSATPQLVNQGSCATCGASIGYLFQEGFSGRTEPFEPVETADTVEQSQSLEIVPILPTTTFATITTPNQSLPGGDAIHHALTANLGIPTSWGWGAIMLGIVSAFIVAAAVLTRGNFLAVLIAGGIPVWIATAPGVTIWPVWMAATYTAIAIIGYLVIKGNVIKI